MTVFAWYTEETEEAAGSRQTPATAGMPPPCPS